MKKNKCITTLFTLTKNKNHNDFLFIKNPQTVVWGFFCSYRCCFFRYFSRRLAQGLGKVSGASRWLAQSLGKVSGASRWLTQSLGKVSGSTRWLAQILGNLSGVFESYIGKKGVIQCVYKEEAKSVFLFLIM